MEILGDPKWQGIGTIVSIVALFVTLFLERERLIPSRSSRPNAIAENQNSNGDLPRHDIKAEAQLSQSESKIHPNREHINREIRRLLVLLFTAVPLSLGVVMFSIFGSIVSKESTANENFSLADSVSGMYSLFLGSALVWSSWILITGQITSPRANEIVRKSFRYIFWYFVFLGVIGLVGIIVNLERSYITPVLLLPFIAFSIYIAVVSFLNSLE